MTIGRGGQGGGSKFLYAPFHDAEAAIRRAEEKLAAVEQMTLRLETDRAVNEERQKRLGSHFAQIDKRLDRIDALISRLVWLIVAAILGGFMSFVLKGSLIGV